MNILEKSKILNQCVIGFEYEFYSNLSREDIAKQVSKLVKKKVKVGDVYHSETPIGKDEWKLEPDFSGGIKMCELVTEPMGYFEAISTMTKVMHWIRSNGWTDEKCALQFSLSFDPFKIDIKEKIENIDRLKLVLGFDEEFIYDRFPLRKNSQYARSVKQIYPVNKFVFNDNINGIHRENYKVPDEKYYGINFTKLSKNYIEIRYCGGRGYDKKINEFKEIIDYVVIKIYETMKDPTYSESDLAKLRNILKEHKKVVASFSDVDMFFANYPNVHVFVDLKGDKQVIKTYWQNIREQLFELIINCGMRKGLLNYDADVGKFQLKDAILSKAFPMRDMEVFDSKISGNIINCDLYRCVITNSHILDCALYQGNMVKKSKIINSPIHIYNECQDCYIDNKKLLINGIVEGGIIRSGEIAPTAKVSKSTEIIDQLIKGGKDKDTKGEPGTIGRTKLTITKL